MYGAFALNADIGADWLLLPEADLAMCEACRRFGTTGLCDIM
jgi:hypothetical protein